ncbi:MAG: BlaI/MecI/CopY family transcriptional regulator [Candidatus Latescibacterota bacterium]|nr:BlaI/MecI/CopY family transcriptional regulator [Candidatus Latescibacterota bacterium]
MKRRPTDGELEILQVLWNLGPSTVRRVHETMGSTAAYTTTLKLLQIMHGKGLVRRDETGHAHIYEATPEKDETRLLLARDLAERAFSGSTARLALHALSSARASAEELAEIRALLDRLEGSS